MVCKKLVITKKTIRLCGWFFSFFCFRGNFGFVFFFFFQWYSRCHFFYVMRPAFTKRPHGNFALA